MSTAFQLDFTGHKHSWQPDGKCNYCAAQRCCGKYVSIRREIMTDPSSGTPREVRCKAVAQINGMCLRCHEKVRAKAKR